MLSDSSVDPSLTSKLEHLNFDLKDLSWYIRDDPASTSQRINCLDRCLVSAGKWMSNAKAIADLRSKRRMKNDVTSFEPTPPLQPSNKFSYAKTPVIPSSLLYRSTNNEVIRPRGDILVRPRAPSVTRMASPSPYPRHIPNFPSDLPSPPLRIDTSSTAIDSHDVHRFPTPPNSTSQLKSRTTPVSRFAPPLDLPSPPMSVEMTTSLISYPPSPSSHNSVSTRDTTAQTSRPNFPSPLVLPSPALEADVSSNQSSYSFTRTNSSMTRDTSPAPSYSQTSSPIPRGRPLNPVTHGNIFQGKSITPHRILSRRPSTDISGSSVNADEIGRWFKFGSTKFAAREYAKAEPFLDRVLKESDAQSDWREETMRMLVLIYGKTGRLSEASELLNQGFDGRDGTIETLAGDLCQERRWEEVVKLLHYEFQARENMLERVSRAFVIDEKWSDARSVLIELMRYGGEETMKGLERMSVLAEICWRKGDLEDTKHWCITAMRGEKSVLDKGNPLFAQFVKMMVQVCETQENADGAAEYKALLSFDVQCTSLRNSFSNFRLRGARTDISITTQGCRNTSRERFQRSSTNEQTTQIDS